MPTMQDRGDKIGAGAVEANITTNRSFGCAVFDGVDDRVIVPDSATLKPGTGDFSVLFWVKAIKTASNQTTIAKKNGFNEGWTIAVAGTTGFTRLEDEQADTTRKISSGTSNIGDGLWHRVCCMKSGANNIIYVDGVEEKTEAHSLTASIDTTEDLHIGALTVVTGEWFKGAVSNVKYYNRALTPAEVILDNAGTTPTVGLVSRWKLDVDYTDSVGDNDGTNSGSRLAIVDDAIAAAIAADYTTANDHYMIASGEGGQVVTAIVEEGP